MPPTILVVDDHPETRTLIARTLRPQGYEVTTVADGHEALIMAAFRLPDLVIADVLLPGLNGLSVVDTLRQQDPRLSVIAMSAVHDVLERPELVPPGLDPDSISFLAKPFGLTALMALVHQVLPLPLAS
jgi:two-component system OmpR family response regulator